MLTVSAHWGDTVLDHASFEDDTGAAELADQAFDLGELRDELDRTPELRLERGPLDFIVRDLATVSFRQPELLDRLDYRWINSLLFVLFLHTIAVTAFEGTPLGRGMLSIPRAVHRGKMVQVALTPAVPRPAPKAISPGPGKVAARRGSPGPKRDLVRDLFGTGAAKQALGGERGLGTALESALAGVRGSEIGDAGGGGGGGSRSGHPLGGGMSSVGIGELERRPADYGEGLGTMKIGKSVTDLEPKLGPPVIRGALDKEVIRRVIKDHIAQIRYCYERELVRDPGAFGKITTRFTIGPEGTVVDVDIKESFAGDRQLSSCIAEKIRTWRFPKPKGGGVVVVHYPFLVNYAG
jgi:hypothetical protein